jgi:hypothetical protein
VVAPTPHRQIVDELPRDRRRSVLSALVNAVLTLHALEARIAIA